jgi:hypothetical protein
LIFVRVGYVFERSKHIGNPHRSMESLVSVCKRDMVGSWLWSFALSAFWIDEFPLKRREK